MSQRDALDMTKDDTAKKPSLAEQFVENLETLRKEKDNATLAKLKRNAGNTLAESKGVRAIFFKLLPYGVPEWHEPLYFLVATLYPLTDAAKKGSLGYAMKLAHSNPKIGRNGLDRRMEVLLDSDVDQLPFRLRQIVKLLKSAEVPVNWVQLLEDLHKWHYLSRRVQEKWARDYYVD